jgi:hypothetical protein
MVVQMPSRHRIQRYFERFIACSGHPHPISGADGLERSGLGANALFRRWCQDVAGPHGGATHYFDHFHPGGCNV